MFWSNVSGVISSFLRIGFTGPRLKDSSGNLVVRNSSDGADAEITVSKANISGNSAVLNSDATGTGADWTYTLARPASGMTANVTLTLPIDDGSPDQVLSTDGSGALAWVSAASTASSTKRDTTTLSYNSASPVSMFTLPAGAVLDKVTCIIDTAFNGSPSASVGIVGVTSKYLGATDIDLTSSAGTRFDVLSSNVAAGGTEALIITYAAGGASTGSARLIVDYSTPA